MPLILTTVMGAVEGAAQLREHIFGILADLKRREERRAMGQDPRKSQLADPFNLDRWKRTTARRTPPSRRTTSRPSSPQSKGSAFSGHHERRDRTAADHGRGGRSDLGVGRTTIYALVKSDDLVPIRIGKIRATRFRRRDVLALAGEDIDA